MLLGASKLLVQPATSSYLRIFYGKRLSVSYLCATPADPWEQTHSSGRVGWRSYGKHLDDVTALREALGIKPSRRNETVDRSPEPANITSLLSSMAVITKPKETVPASGVIEKVRAGLAYYEWTFYYSRLMPPELQYLTSRDRCGICHSSFSSLDEARQHYLSPEHETISETFLDRFYSASPLEKPLRLDHIDHTVWQQMYDRPLPEQMTELCTPHHCGLCDEQLSGPVEMRRHYSRTPHSIAVARHLDVMFSFTPERRPVKLRRNYWYLLWKDRRLPTELLVQCTEQRCGLCSTALGDRETADRHYTSEQHTAETDAFLERFFAGSEMGPPRKIAAEEIHFWTHRFRDLPSAIVNKCSSTRCHLCQTDLPNYGVAKSHYEGRGHLDVVRWYLHHLKLEGYREARRSQPSDGKFGGFKF